MSDSDVAQAVAVATSAISADGDVSDGCIVAIAAAVAVNGDDDATSPAAALIGSV
jgi:hypothetical protein